MDQGPGRPRGRPSDEDSGDGADAREGEVLTLDEALTRHVGAFGLGQAIQLVAASLSWVALACVALAMVFLSADPVRARAWRCASPSDAACAAALAAAPADAAPFCALPRAAYEFDPPRLSVVAEFGLVCGGAWRAAVGNSAYFVGIWLGSTPFGWLSDARGRRACLVASNIASAAACLLCAAAPGFWAYAAGRGLLGFCAAGMPIGAYLLATEAVGPARRGVAGLLTQLIYHPGEWVLPLFAALRDWRHLNVALAAVCVGAAAAAALVPESPRWLLTRGRAAEAEAVVACLAAWNGRALPPGTSLRAGEGEGAAARRAEAAAAAAEAGGAPGKRRDGGRSRAPEAGADGGGWRLLFAHPLLRRSLLVTSFVSAACAVGFFVAGLASDALQGYSVERAFFVTSLFEVPAYVLGAAAIDTAGRRATVFGFLSLSALSSAGCALLGPGAAQVVLATINRGAVSAAWGTSYIIAAEACITPLRSQALGLNNQAARLSGIAAPGVPYLAARLGAPALPFWAMAALGGGAAAAVLLLPETRGRAQADTIEQLEDVYRPGGGGGGGGDAGGGGVAGGGGDAFAGGSGRDQGPGAGGGEEEEEEEEGEEEAERAPLVGGGRGSRGGAAAGAAAGGATGRRPAAAGRALWPSFSFSLSPAASGDAAPAAGGEQAGGFHSSGAGGGGGGGGGRGGAASRLGPPRGGAALQMAPQGQARESGPATYDLC
ncbi:MAG: major facilitator superfamily domain-containing protein [Monoraphidium minutum]|nr:MAG: major facilitator superfamily domain-containing protein [Monoraphidium minutum]